MTFDHMPNGDGVHDLTVAGVMGGRVWHFATVSSTNTVLRDLVARAEATHGSVVVADEQTAGRGRLGRPWLSEPGSSLLCSVFLSPVETRLTYSLAALAVRDAIIDATGLAPAIKWPNDILLEGRKVSGILAEQVAGGSIVGIGVNANMNVPELARIGPGATSLAGISGGPVNRTRLFEQLMEHLERQYRRSREAPELVFQDWRSALTTVGKRVEVETGREVWTGRAVDVAEDGSLLVCNDKQLVRVYAGDVRIRSQ